MEGYEKVLGAEHPDILTSVYSLASLFQAKRQFDDASDLYLRATAGYRKILGPDHPTTVACSENYESILNEMRRGP